MALLMQTFMLQPNKLINHLIQLRNWKHKIFFMEIFSFHHTTQYFSCQIYNLTHAKSTVFCFTFFFLAKQTRLSAVTCLLAW